MTISGVPGQNLSVPMAQTNVQAPQGEKVEVHQKDTFKKGGEEKLTGIWKAADAFGKTLGAGFGLSSGAAGGFVIGGAVAASGSLISGLLNHTAALSSAGAAGLTGGIVGAVVFGACGMLGGYNISSIAVHGLHKAVDFISDQIKGSK